MEALISTYGYAAVLVGTFLEGETILVLAGFLAHRGYLDLPWVMGAAFVGTTLGDQLYFFLGERYGTSWIDRRPALRARLDRVLGLIGRNEVLFILGFRFLYGLRTITPAALALSGVTWRRFLALNAIGAAIWAIAFGSAGYLAGRALELILGDIKRIEMGILGAAALLAVLAWLLRHLRRRRTDQGEPGRKS